MGWEANVTAGDIDRPVTQISASSRETMINFASCIVNWGDFEERTVSCLYFQLEDIANKIFFLTAGKRARSMLIEGKREVIVSKSRLTPLPHNTMRSIVETASFRVANNGSTWFPSKVDRCRLRVRLVRTKGFSLSITTCLVIQFCIYLSESKLSFYLNKISNNFLSLTLYPPYSITAIIP